MYMCIFIVVSNVNKRTPSSPMKGKKSLVVEKHRKLIIYSTVYVCTCTCICIQVSCMHNCILIIFVKLVGSTNISPSPTANSLGSGQYLYIMMHHVHLHVLCML